MPGPGGSESRPHADRAALLPFRNPDAGKSNLERVGARLSPGLAATLPGLLAEAPDPDRALVLFERLIEAPE
ncbi:MAG TPA: hypothetical protein VEU11_04035, partial [Terriglobales bacterium]|nr:hypothetical protein [Terriglobales bacterium]